MGNSEPEGVVKAVIFDLDGVLLDSEWIGFKVWQEMVASYGGRLDDSALRQGNLLGSFWRSPPWRSTARR